MKRLTFSLLTAWLCLFWVSGAWAQDYAQRREELLQKQEQARSKVEQINSQIRKYEERLGLAEKKFDRLSKQYENLKRIIALQEEKMNRLEEEQRHIGEEISVTEQEIARNEDHLQKLVDDYKKTLRHVYKHGRTTDLALLFSSASINQMLVRAQYLQKFKDYREEQARKIKEAQEELRRNRDQLQRVKDKNDDVLAEIQQEKQKQEQKKEQQEKNVALLKENVQEIREQKERLEEQKKNFNKTITDITVQLERFRKQEEERKRNLAKARAIENDAERAREVAKYSKPVSPGTRIPEEELDKIEDTFAKDKGQLPWPVDSRTISEHFGRKRHPVYGTITPNLGIEIVTEQRSPVRVVHNGYVVDVLPLTGYGDVVLVSHGKYITVYGNLSQVLTQKGAILTKGDVVGLSGDENSPKGTSVFFMVRESNTNLDPENWLAKK